MYSFLHRLLVSLPLKALFLSTLVLTLVPGRPYAQFQGQWFQMGTPAIAQDSDPAQLVQNGVDAYNQGDYPTAIAAWKQALSIYPTTAVSERALVNENLARTYQQIGETQASINAWEAAATAYEQSDNSVQYGRMLTEQAQIYVNLGQYQRAAALLCGAEPEITGAATDASISCAGGSLSIAETTEDGLGQVAALGSLAETYRLRGEYEIAQALLQAGLHRVNTQAVPQYEAPLLSSLGNTHARLSQVAGRRAEAAELLNKVNVANELRNEAQANAEQALANFTDAIAIAKAQPDLRAELRSHLGLLALYQIQDNIRAINTSQQRLAQLIEQLPSSRETAYAAITLAKSYQASRNFACDSYRESSQVQIWLETGRRIADQIGDDRAASFALGELGHVEECRGNLAIAVSLTNQAQLAASNALESADSLIYGNGR